MLPPAFPPARRSSAHPFNFLEKLNSQNEYSARSIIANDPDTSSSNFKSASNLVRLRSFHFLPFNDHSCKSGLVVFDDPLQIGATTSCLFYRQSFNARIRPRKDVLGFRLPWLSPTGHLFFLCSAYAHFFSIWLAASGNSNSSKTRIDAWDKECHAGKLTVNEYINQVVSYANGREYSSASLRSNLQSWFLSDSSGQAWMQSLQRAHDLTSPFRVSHEFFLEAQEEQWKIGLPSEASSRALGDVNTHAIQLPLKNVELLVAANAHVDFRGRVTAIQPHVKHFEVFYPKVAPWAFKVLMLTPIGPYRKNISFTVNVEDREKYLKSLDAESLTECQKIANEMLVQKQFSSSKPCLQGVAVARLFVISQQLSREMFHFLCESFPRAGAFLDWLREDSTLFIHATSCLSKIGYCQSFLEHLGIDKSRILDSGGRVFAGEVFVPSGGRGHWPLANLWGIESVVQSSALASPAPDCSLGNILIIKRRSTRLSPFSSSSYQNWAKDIQKVFPHVEIRFFDDADKVVLQSMPLQIALLQWADVVVGAHGAAMSWLPFAKSCTHFVSLRGRSNSDIYEQLAIGFGIGFHHAQFRYRYEDYVDEIITGVGDALAVQRASVARPVKPPRIMGLKEPWGKDADVLGAFDMVSPKGCATYSHGKTHQQGFTHFALMNPHVKHITSDLVRLFASEFWKYPLVAFFQPGNDTSFLLMVHGHYKARIKKCSLTVSELADFDSVLAVRAAGSDLECANVQTPYRWKATELNVGVKGQADMLERSSDGQWVQRAIPRDLCFRAGPSVENLGETALVWRLKDIIL